MTDDLNIDPADSLGLDPGDETLQAFKELEDKVCKVEDEALCSRVRHAVEHLAEHSERAHIVAKCAKHLVQAEKPIDVLESTLFDAIRLTEAERGYILMWNESTQALEPATIEGGSNKAPTGSDLQICNSIARKAFDTGKVIINPNVQKDPEFRHASSVVEFQIRSVLVAPLIAETNKGQQKLGVVYLDSRAAKHLFVEDDAELMESFAALAAISIAHLRAVRQLRDAYRQTVNALIRALEAKDKYTRGHSERVAEYSVRCGKEMGLSRDRLVMLEAAALLHDVGKIGIRDAVLHKPGKLTDEEYEHIKLHAELSEEIVKGLDFLKDEVAILAGSQEHYDGTGYPRGTKGDEIQIEGYIIQAADAWDAMTSTRVYRVALKTEDAIAELKKFSGSQFHPKVVEAFLTMIDRDGNIPSG